MNHTFLSEIRPPPVLRVFLALSTSGFDRHASPVFHPTVPEAAIEDCLAAMGDRVAAQLDPQLAAAVDALLAGSVCSSLPFISNNPVFIPSVLV